MIVEQKKVNFEDARGTIMDIFTKAPKDHATIIFTKKDGVRGNHYHKLTTQSDFIVSGSMEIFGKKEGEQVRREVIGVNSFVIWEPNEQHSFRALEDTVFITFNEGLRGGEDYEKDTFRLDVPLHVQYEQEQQST